MNVCFLLLETDVRTLDDDSRMMVLAYKSNKGKKRERSLKTIPKYCHFVLFKQNKDTMDCINLISKLLRIKTSNFAYAGTKDRRATTIQKVSVQKTLSQRLHGLNAKLRNIAVGNFEYREEGLSLGALSGNEFTLVIRDVSSCTEGEVDEACASLRDKGFINYFGLQRFGTGSVPTHQIGKFCYVFMRNNDN